MYNRSHNISSEEFLCKDSNDLEETRDKLVEKKYFKSALKEIIFYVIFVLLIMMITYQMVEPKAYEYQKNLRNLYGAGDKSNQFLDVEYIF